jgi:hypothetical protein
MSNWPRRLTVGYWVAGICALVAKQILTDVFDIVELLVEATMFTLLVYFFWRLLRRSSRRDAARRGQPPDG